MEYYKNLFNSIKEEYEAYQKVSESNIQELSNKNVKLERKIDSLTNIIEVSKYINAYLSNENLLTMMNDMIIGILGVAYSTIFILEEEELSIRSTNIEDKQVNLTSEEIKYIYSGEEYLINSKDEIRKTGNGKHTIRSVIGVPISLGSKSIGYIVVEHEIYNFMNVELKIFLRAIANQIAIALENSFLYKQLERITQTDPLLGIYNRKYFFQVLDKKMKENNEKFAIAMVDIDNFKKVNDTYGHQFGDATLIETTKTLCKWTEENDLIARYGGEEIILYFEKFDDDDNVHNKLEIMRRAVEENNITLNGVTKSVTASFGVAFYPNDGSEPAELIKCADELLYEAKRSGKNMVVGTRDMLGR